MQTQFQTQYCQIMSFMDRFLKTKTYAQSWQPPFCQCEMQSSCLSNSDAQKQKVQHRVANVKPTNSYVPVARKSTTSYEVDAISLTTNNFWLSGLLGHVISDPVSYSDSCKVGTKWKQMSFKSTPSFCTVKTRFVSVDIYMLFSAGLGILSRYNA